METNTTFIPEPEVLEEEGSLPDNYQEFNNLAKDENVVKPLWSWIQKQYELFDNQDHRKKYVTETLRDIDKMYRVSLLRDTSSAQHENTLSNVCSTMYRRQVDTITASHYNILFFDKEMPAEYVTEVNTDEFLAEDGEKIAKQDNALAQYTFDEDDVKNKLKAVIFDTIKDANAIVSYEWAEEWDEKTERVPEFGPGPDGDPVVKGYKFETKRRRVKHWPTMIQHDIDKVWFNSQIDDMNMQRCVIIQSKTTLEKLLAAQASGIITNLDKINQESLYQGESQDDSALEDMKLNSGEADIVEEDGSFIQWDVYCRVPIKEFKKKGKGKWDPSSTIPTLYWTTFLGQMGSANAVCTRLQTLPYFHGEIPVQLVHSHRDKRGAYHAGIGEVLLPLYWEATSNINCAIDNIKERHRAPIMVDGEVHTRDMTYRGNKIIRVGRGVRWERVPVPDSTQLTMELHDRIESDANQTTGADKPVQGEGLGARATALEAKQTLDQALLPLDVQADYIANQLFNKQFRLSAALWRQYGDPKMVLHLTHNNLEIDVAPAELYGPVKTKITAITRFRNSSVRRQELNALLQTMVPMFKDIMGKTGMRTLGLKVLKEFGLTDLREIFPPIGDHDAEHKAMQEAVGIFVEGEPLEPAKGENHPVHISIHQKDLRSYSLAPDADPDRIRMMEAHVEMHEQLADEDNMAIQPGEGGEMQKGMEGELASNPMEAAAGAQANM